MPSEPTSFLLSPAQHGLLTLFGGFRIHIGGVPLQPAVSVQRLIAYLAIQGPALRSDIASALWSDTTDNSALACLRTTIWRANKIMRGLVINCRGLLALADFVDSDVQHFAAEARAQLSEAAEPKISILEIGACDLLPGWDDDWVVFERDRLKQLQLHMMEAMAKSLSLRGDYGVALDIALRAVRTDPLRESARRVVINIHLAEGNLIEALREYKRFHREVTSELGVPPSTALSQLVFERPA